MFLDERTGYALQTKDERNVILGGFKAIRFVMLLLSLLFIVSCSDLGDRDNPLDPGASNYVTSKESDEDSSSSKSIQSSSSSKKTEVSSSSKDSKPVEVSSSSKKSESSSSVNQSSSEKSSESRSSSSSNKANSSSSVTQISSGNTSSSSSKKIESSSSKTTSSSSTNTLSSSSDKQESSSSIQQTSSSRSELDSESSSSKNVTSSSSTKVSSSSITPESSSSEDSWTCGKNPLVRDGVDYKTVVIKETCFTKENMRYVPNAGGNTMCYGDKSENCETYGLLYDYEAASLACPTGWRLPTSAEYVELLEYTGDDMYDAGTHFKAAFGWIGENGDDFLEFTALPGGYCDDEDCYGLGTVGYWWTSTEKVKNASHLTLFLNGDGGAFTAEKKLDNDKFASVRCVKIQK